MCYACQQRAQRLRRLALDFRVVAATQGRKAHIAEQLIASAEELERVAKTVSLGCDNDDDVVWDDSSPGALRSYVDEGVS